MKRLVGSLVLLLLLALGPSRATAQTPDPPERWGTVYIPAIQLVKPVSECPLVDGWYDTSWLGDGVCHLEGTTWITDNWGRVGLAGHTPGAFDDLVWLAVGDQILVFDDRVIEVYEVTQMAIVTVSDIQWIMPTTTEHLTLITCSGARRLVVDAVRIQ
jgi:LPXTG-site transpeptidase (sortase) family protein